MITGVWLGPENQWGDRDDIAVQFDEEQILAWRNGEHVDEKDNIGEPWVTLVAEDPIARLIDEWHKAVKQAEEDGDGRLAEIIDSCAVELTAALDTARRLSTSEEDQNGRQHEDDDQGRSPGDAGGAAAGGGQADS